MLVCAALKQTRGGAVCGWVRDRWSGEVATARRGQTCGWAELRAAGVGALPGCHPRGCRAWGDIRFRPYGGKPRATPASGATRGGSGGAWRLRALYAGGLVCCKGRVAHTGVKCAPARVLQGQSRAHGHQARADSCRAKHSRVPGRRYGGSCIATTRSPNPRRRPVRPCRERR